MRGPACAFCEGVRQRNNALTVFAREAGTGALTKSGNGTLLLSAAGSYGGGTTAQNVFWSKSFNTTVSKFMGKHNIKAGYDYRLLHHDGRIADVAVPLGDFLHLGLGGVPLGRALRERVAWYGDADLIPHFIGVLASGAVDVTVSWGNATAYGMSADRKQIARDAVNAVECALAMQQRLIALNQSLQQRGLPLIGMRIGILTGPMVAGSLGTAHRMEYNCHGDTVNTGARLESFGREEFTPDYLDAPCRILVGEPTLRLLGGRFRTEFLGEFHLKGKLKPLRIHRVHGRAGMAEVDPVEVNSAHADSAVRR